MCVSDNATKSAYLKLAFHLTTDRFFTPKMESDGCIYIGFSSFSSTSTDEISLAKKDCLSTVEFDSYEELLHEQEPMCLPVDLTNDLLKSNQVRFLSNCITKKHRVELKNVIVFAILIIRSESICETATEGLHCKYFEIGRVDFHRPCGSTECLMPTWKTTASPVRCREYQYE